MDIIVNRLVLYLQILLATMVSQLQCQDGLIRVRLFERFELNPWAKKQEFTNRFFRPEFLNYSSFINIQYYGKLTVGNPQQKMRVMFDTSTSDFWIPSIQNDVVKLLRCYTKPKIHLFNSYNGDVSKTHEYNGKKCIINYRSGVMEGFLSSDSVTLNRKTILNQTFIEAVNQNKIPFYLLDIDGVFGLGYKEKSQSGITPPFYNMIEQGLLKAPVFSLHFPRDPEIINKGEIIFGGSDPTKYEDPLAYVPVTKPGHWQFRLDEILIGGKPTKIYTRDAAIDTGSGIIFGPADEVKLINDKIGAILDKNGIYTVKQKKVNCKVITGLPPITFQIGNKQFSLQGKDYVLKLKTEKGPICIPAFYTIDPKRHSERIWILGNVFVNRFYLEFDMGKNRIGFGKIKPDVIY